MDLGTSFVWPNSEKIESSYPYLDSMRPNREHKGVEADRTPMSKMKAV